jgi:predicted component of type VI protein secretion system
VAERSYQLVVRKGPRPGQVFSLTLDTIVLGRDPLADIVLNDPEISRHHAQLKQTAEGYEFKDLGSTNGSFVDGKRMGGEPVMLTPGQVVMLGSNVTLIYQATSADPMATMVAPMGSAEPPTSLPVGQPPSPEPDRPDFERSPAVEEPPATTPLPHSPVPEPEYEEPLRAEPEPLPPFDRMDASTEFLPQADVPERGPLATYPESEPLLTAAPPELEQPFQIPPPPPPPGKRTGVGGFNQRNLVIAIVVALALCCCCGLIAAALYQADILNLQFSWLQLESFVMTTFTEWA